jgi:diaminohydroxyphosphoribosylaminopyrimidine deaminase/5-amino-6-(5-phosphoribosylamino)uracil reductase
MTKNEADIFYMNKVLLLAAKGKYTVQPNPMVGALVVKDNKIIGSGYHRKPGTPHAEQVAIKKAGDKSHNATLYINLEPCCHYGRTPPCSDLIIESKISRVVISSLDPNPLVNGKSVKQLRRSGVIVKTGVLKHQSLDLNKGFFSKFTNKRPHVTAKFGVSLDGKISLFNGKSKWITSPDSRIDAQEERASRSLIFTSSKTVLKDNPQMTIRNSILLNKIIRQPDIAIIDRNLKIPINSKIFNDKSRLVYIFTNRKQSSKKYRSNVVLVKISSDNGKMNIKECLHFLAKQDINNILLESGSNLMSSFLKEKLVDQLILYFSPRVLGSSAISFSGIQDIEKLSKKIKFTISDIIIIKKDLKLVLESNYV